MTENERKTITITPAQLAHLGEGAVAYMREMDAQDLRGKFPGIPDMAPGTKLWALFAANGQPIMLTDARDAAIAGAFQNDLKTVSVH
ncbi:hypothetical protein L598_000600000650 [Mesorhizobium sp. J18]|uniref:BQ00720 family protein n=1 Tax=Mesorhizobium sp. J18 TaxID=935263 RepID=UPI001199FD17|nr:DUF1150 family protein [Mesorhizobium sp. J18]TWG91325.1 hypothetical protein L598_000600000650 [Mesorhizobium sp. J18]